MRKRPDEMRPEYGPDLFRKGVRGKYYKCAIAGTNLVLIEPEIFEVFPSGEAVDNALRRLIRAGNGRTPKRQTRKRAHTSSR